MALQHYDRKVSSVFSLLGDSENAITTSIAWSLSQCPVFLNLLVKGLGFQHETDDIQVATQSFGSDRGFTDIEIYEPGVMHIIVEAKRGWWLPDRDQFTRYMPRFQETRTPIAGRLLLSMGEASQTYANLNLPKHIRRVPVRHLSWRDILKVVGNSSQQTKSHEEKRWLKQLYLFLEGIASMQNQRSNEVYVVSLSADEIVPGSGYTWINVVEEGKYFHPVGTKGWPAEPPNYVGFRYHGKLQSIHHVRSYEVVKNPKKANPKWVNSPIPHFVYDLGNPIHPQTELRSGPIQNARMWCLIDTLISGEHKTIREANEASKKRLAEDR